MSIRDSVTCCFGGSGGTGLAGMVLRMAESVPLHDPETSLFDLQWNVGSVAQQTGGREG